MVHTCVNEREKMDTESAMETERGGREDKRERLNLRCSLPVSLSLSRLLPAVVHHGSYEHHLLNITATVAWLPALSLYLSVALSCFFLSLLSLMFFFLSFESFSLTPHLSFSPCSVEESLAHTHYPAGRRRHIFYTTHD